jgi:hypothetical protein
MRWKNYSAGNNNTTIKKAIFLDEKRISFLFPQNLINDEGGSKLNM